MKSAGRYFSPDYSTARDRFRETAARSGANLDALVLSAKGPAGEQLSIDVAWFGDAAPDRVLLHSSGLHGVEGFAGAAIQLQFIETPPAVPPGAALVFMHVLNPYGMAWLQRVNEHNVDLNRNFRSENSYSGAPEAYGKLNEFLNPPTPPRSDFFFLKAAYIALRHGITPVKQAIAGGQYEYSSGLFFGGRQMEEGPRKCAAFLAGRLSDVNQVAAIDVHTGLGRFGHELALVEPEDYIRLREMFGSRITAPQPARSSAYQIEGGFETMLFRMFSKRRPIFIRQEFGTYNSLRVLHALREENRWRRYGDGTIDHPTKQNMKQMFCPDDETWREAVLKQGRSLVEAAMARLRRVAP